MTAHVRLKKIVFFLLFLGVLVLTFLFSFLVAFFKNIFVLPSILGNSFFSYTFWEAIISFSIWGIITYISFLIYYYSFSSSGIRKKIKIEKSSLFISLLMALFLFQVREIAVPFAAFKKNTAEDSFQYATFFYNSAMDNYNEAEELFFKKLEDIPQKDIKLTDIRVVIDKYKKAKNQFLFYLSYDPKAWLDQYALSGIKKNEKKDKYKIDIRRKKENQQSIELILYNLDTILDRLFLLEKQYENFNVMTPEYKYRKVDQATFLLDSAKKQEDILKAIKAYEIYRICRKMDFSDNEFQQGMRLSEKVILDQTFFRSEVIPLFRFSNAKNLYLNKESDFIFKGYEVKREELKAKQMVFSLGVVFFKDLELTAYSSKNEFLYKIKSDFTMWKNGKFIFSNLNNKINEKEFKTATIINKKGEANGISSIQFKTSKLLLSYLGEGKEQKNYLSLFIITSLLSHYKRFELQKILLQVEFLMHIFTFLFLIFIPLFLINIKNILIPRKKESFFKVLLFIPFLVIAIYYCCIGIFYSQRIFLFWLSYAFSIKTTIIFFSILWFLLIMFLLLRLFLKVVKNKE